MQASTRRTMLVSGIALAAAVIGQTASADPGASLRWQSVIGIAAPNGIVGSGTGAVTGAPGPWSALGGKVKVDPYKGRIEFSVDGLVLAAGNSIGTPGAITQLKGTIVCDTDGSASAGNSVLVDTPFVELDDQGDARFNGHVAVPAVCASEPDVAFLLRTSSGRWIANGAVLR